MIFTLLQTRMRIPPDAGRLIPRPGPAETIECAVPDHKLVLLSAPAGFGKTTLLTQWARATPFRVAWVSLDREDDVERFLRYLIAAWEVAEPGVSDGPLGILAGSAAPDRETLLAEFINAGARQANHTVFVLDDYHAVEDPAIHDSLVFLLDHLPSTIHFVLSCRGEPPLPLGRYRARQELLELRTGDLQFSVEETESFLNDVMDLGLEQTEIESAHHQMEGWAAGLHLVALACRAGYGSSVVTVSGRQRHIADYLSQDVLVHLSNDVRQFLLQTSILDQLRGDLCDAVTSRDDGQEMLEFLEREDLFLLPLDDRREWYRYHRVFAGFLREDVKRYDEESIAGLHQRAARWYLLHDLPETAFQHAIEAGNSAVVIEVIERYAYAKVLAGEVRVVQRWFDALPTQWIESEPVVGVYRSMLLIATGAFEACHQHLDELERRLAREAESEHRRTQLARVTALRCILACFRNDLPAAERYAEEALPNLPVRDFNFRPGIFGALGDTYRRNNRWNDARAWYLKILDFGDAPALRAQSAHLYGALADLNLRQGRLREAAKHWRQAIASIEDPENRGRFELPLMGWVYVRMGELLYEWNAPGEAWDLITHGRTRADAGGDVRTLIAANLTAGRIKLSEGDVAAASAYLQQTRDLVASAAFPEWTDGLARLQVEVWLAERQIGAVARWADTALAEQSLQSRSESSVVQLTAARVLVAKGDWSSLARAQALLDSVVHSASTDSRKGVEIEALALKALAHWQGGEPTSALTSLEQALRLAEPEGYVRLFVDLGLPMIRLLQEARSRAVMPGYVGILLEAAGMRDGREDARHSTLPEPLSNREQEVLRLISAGLTNAEIGAQLFISPETVKKHTGNIYAKLSVRNRAEAVARARDLGALPQ